MGIMGGSRYLAPFYLSPNSPLHFRFHILPWRGTFKFPGHFDMHKKFFTTFPSIKTPILGVISWCKFLTFSWCSTPASSSWSTAGKTDSSEKSFSQLNIMDWENATRIRWGGQHWRLRLYIVGFLTLMAYILETITMPIKSIDSIER